MSDTVIADEASGTTTIVVPARGSVVLVEAPVGGTLERTATATLVDGVPVAYVATTSPEPNPPVNVALDADITWSSDQNGNVGTHLVDGTTGTRWESETADPQWFEIDLGAVYDLDRFVISWEFASAKSYTIDVSLDGETWTTAHSTTTGPGGVENLIVAPTPAQHIRFTGTERNTQYAYSAYELEAYGTPSDTLAPEPVTPPTDAPTTAPSVTPTPATPAYPGTSPTVTVETDGMSAKGGGAATGTGAGTAAQEGDLASTGASVGALVAGSALLLVGVVTVAGLRRRRST